MRQFVLAVSLATAAVTVPAAIYGQAVSVNGGSIQGTITDASGASVPHAEIEIRSVDQGTTRHVTADSAGYYAIGPLNPGNYTLLVTAAGFERLEVQTRILTGTATPGTFKLRVGQSTETVEVNAGAIQVNTDQVSVSDVITNEQLQNLPVNGRNFLDVAQIEPGVILQQGSTFDPTKAGYSAISVSGVSGRTTRILLDGQDITDETVGATILNVSQGAINEFQLNRSTQDISGELTSSGSVQVATQSGSNKFHGLAFYQFQDARAGFATSSYSAGRPPFQRNQYGGSIGGPILKDKLFFFGNAERIQQAQGAATLINTTLYPALAARYPIVSTPYKNTYSTVRLDYNGPLGGHYFARASYQVDGAVTNRSLGYWLFNNRDNTPAIAFGADFAHGKMTHSFRGSYEKFHNFIADATQFGSTGQYYPYQGVAVYNSAGALYGGPNYLAPQQTFQSDKQLRYDGTRTEGRHSIKFGASMNRILGGGFAAFYGLGPRIATTSATRIAGGNCPAVGGAFSDLNVDPFSCYYPSAVNFSNGTGYATPETGFGQPGGGLFSYRFAAYLGDSWKVTPNFTLLIGARWSVDTARQGQNLAPPLCSEITDPRLTPACAGVAGSTPILSLIRSKFTGRTNQPYKNVGPQIGFNYAPGDHKTTFRGGIGVYYETAVFNQLTNANSFERSGLIYNGQSVCGGANSYYIPTSNGNQTLTTSPNGSSIATLCSQPISQSYQQFIAIENNVKQATTAVGPSANGGFLAKTLALTSSAFAPDYRTPYAVQFNAGIQRELFRGAVLSADYVHNGTQRIGQSIDLNHVGSARSLNVAAARAAIVRAGGTNTGTTADLQAAIAKGTTVKRLSAAGLDSGTVFLSGQPDALKGYTASTGAAFPGLNPNFGRMLLIEPVGRSGYDALQVVYRQQREHPLPGVQSGTLQLSYSLSRNITNSTGGSDEFFSSAPYDYDQPLQYMGRNGLDHLHSLNLGGTFVFRYGPQLGLIGHFYSAPPSTLALDALSGSAGQILQTDVTGDGTTADIVPGTNPGYYMHQVKSGNLAQFISTYNGNFAGKPTPAGQALINAGIATQAQLYQLGAVTPTIAAPVNGSSVSNPVFRTFDATVGYPIRLGKYVHGLNEAISLTPTVAMYNVFNMANYANLTSTLVSSNYGALAGTGTAGTTANNYLNGPNTANILYNNRTQRGAGTFSQGAPRATEFQLKLIF